MNTRFIFPVAVALAVNGSLLLGSRHAPRTVTPCRPLTCELTPERILITEPEKPKPAEDRTEVVTKGDPDVRRPELPEPLTLPKPTDPVIESRPPAPNADFGRVSFEPPGRPDGKPDAVSVRADSIVSSA